MSNRKGFVIFISDDDTITGVAQVELNGIAAEFTQTIELTEPGRDILAGAIAVALEMVEQQQESN